MRIGVPREVKDHEYRVAMTAAGARELVQRGHEVYVEHDAGAGSAIADVEYVEAGAHILWEAAEVWHLADLVVKVKEPVASEYPLLRAEQVLFTYLHLAADRPCTEALLASGTTSIAYETVRGVNGVLPLLAPMSEIAGRLAPQVGAYHLMRPAGGRGVLPGGVPGVAPARVAVIGGGVAGTHAAQVAHGMRAAVTVLDRDPARLRALDELFGGAVRTLYSTTDAVETCVLEADLVIGAVLVAGARTPTLVDHDLVMRMRPGAVLVDIAIDQGGCFADSRPTTHSDPVYPVGRTMFYCVANMPGAVPATSTQALTNATLPYVEAVADLGWRDALSRDPGLAQGLTTDHGRLHSEAVGLAHDLPVAPMPV